MQLSSRVAVITGGAGGIGTAITTALARAGASVAVWDRDASSAAALAGEVEIETTDAAQPSSLGIGVDVTDRASVDAALQATEDALGEVDILVNNAGIDVIGAFLDSREDDWRSVVEVNLLGTVRCCHAVGAGMVARGAGTIVNVASDAGRVGSSGEVVYSGTKGGVIAFTKALAREVAGDGVRVNCVCPGPTDTPLLAQLAAHDQRLHDGLARAIPMRRIGRPDDVAPIVVFLASDGAGYITGQTISVSGGLTMA